MLPGGPGDHALGSAGPTGLLGDRMGAAPDVAAQQGTVVGPPQVQRKRPVVVLDDHDIGRGAARPPAATARQPNPIPRRIRRRPPGVSVIGARLAELIALR